MDILSTVDAGVRHALSQLADPEERLYWLYLLSALALACLVYLGSPERRKGVSLVGYLFPKSVWLHRSALLDYVYVAVTTIFWSALVAPHVVNAESVTRWLTTHFGSGSAAMASGAAPGILIATLYTITLILADDFRRYLVHRLFHKVPALWEFHKVHHSARVLTPATVYREHPVEMLLSGIAAALVIGVVTAAFLFAFPGGLTLVTILGVNAGRFVFDMLGSNLRHSHIWLRFGRAAEHILISPAQHQIHHSREPRHYDRNFGSQFAIWDWAFGTLYVPERYEALEFGLGSPEDERLSTLPALYFRPFLAVFAPLLSGRQPSRQPGDRA